MYPLKSDHFMCLRPECQGSILRDMKGWAFDQIMKSMSYVLKLPPHFSFIQVPNLPI